MLGRQLYIEGIEGPLEAFDLSDRDLSPHANPTPIMNPRQASDVNAVVFATVVFT